MKKILTSLLTLVALATVVTAGSVAYFSDVEVTDDNTFQAGQLDLQVDFYDVYVGAGEPVVTQWEAQDLDGSEQFWNLDDVKPGDSGYGYISLHLNDNPAWTRAIINEVHNDENLCTEPEQTVDSSCADPGQGELAQFMHWMIWIDLDQDGEYDAGTETLLYDGMASDIVGAGVLSLDITSDPLPSGVTYLGYSWEIDETVGNEIQTDSLTADITFEVEQSRHNEVPSWNED